MTDNNDDFIVLTDKDLCLPVSKKCMGITIRGKPCKNKSIKDGIYCRLHCDKFRLDKPEECPICMESTTDINIPLSCGHWVHKKCIIDWGKEQCPVCRSSIKLTQKEKAKIRKKNTPTETSDDVDLPPQLLELLRSIMYSFPYAIHDGSILNIDIQNDSIILINDFDIDDEDIVMFSSTEFV